MNSNIRYQNFWSYAILALRSKNKVARKSWKKGQYIECLNGTDLIYHNVNLTIADYDANDWQIYVPTYTIKDMKVGQKFRCNRYHGNRVLMKINTPNHVRNDEYNRHQEYIDVETGDFWHVNPMNIDQIYVEPVI